MNLQERIENDLKDAMRQGDALTRGTLRMVLAAVKNRRIETGKELAEPEVMAVLQKAVKSREDSARQYDDAGRAELAANERAEVEVIRRYLPAEMSDDELRGIVKTAIDELGITSRKELGKLMKKVMADHRGAVDGKSVQGIAGELLE